MTEAQSIYCRVIALANGLLAPDAQTINLPAVRKWLVRSERLAFNTGWAWTVTAPSGARRWFANWSMMQSLVPFFVMGEQCPALRAELPKLYDAGVPV